ncbi:MAG: aminotransferase class III-fold pyridoxal phosphate-dependent enzyme [Vulcanimicrobiota bacterium]
MSARVPLAPVVEEIANRWGFFGLQDVGPASPIQLPEEALAGLQFYGEPLKFSDVLGLLPSEVTVQDDFISFPLTVELDALPEWRRSVREMFRILAEENPRRLGRRELYRWDKPRTPENGMDDLPLSQHFLERSYRDGFIVQEKKPLVVDYRRCQRNYLASVDSDGPMPAVLLMDASSQIASHLLGFNGPALRCVLAHPETFQNLDYRHHLVPAERALKAVLLRWAPPGLEYVAWANSGTESWEKALHMATVKFPDRGNKCVCFKGSFHGRSLIALFSSWNPKKRLPFELEGYQTLWAEFPEDTEPHLEKAADPDWLALWELAAEPDFRAPTVDSAVDPLLAAEVDSLMQVREHLQGHEVCAVSVEPMQCEGGDRFGSKRFFQSLRVLTHAMRVALIFDEVQTGFGLGGAELWSNTFDLKTSAGDPLPPDFINLAKKCQVGAVLSSIPDPFPTTAHAASFCRGYVNAASIEPEALTSLGDSVRERLFALAEQFDIVQAPRAQGLAFAFDMPDSLHANNFVNQRFYHGFMVYIAGEKTLRFRIQYSTTPEDLDYIFASITQSLRHLKKEGPESLPDRYDYVWPEVAGPEHPIPVTVQELRTVNWDVILRTYGELPDQRRQEMAKLLEPKPIDQYEQPYRDKQFSWLEFTRYLAGRQAVRIRPLDAENWDKYRNAIMNLERSVYEPARVDEEAFLKAAVEADRSICFVAFERDRLLGFSVAAPLELFSEVRGPDEDPGLNTGKYLYSADLLVHPEARARGVGIRLKRRQIERARQLGYHGIRSRNRVDKATNMEVINRSLGAVEMDYFEKDYGEDQSPCRYLTLPVAESVTPELRWSSGVESPTGGLLSPETWEDWDLAAINKNSLCNWWTPNMTRYTEWLRSVSPLGHAFLASGRDEAADKLVKCLIHHRKGAQTMISFQGAFWGGVTACARSLSDPHFGNHFGWSHLPYPYQEGDPFLGIEDPLNAVEEDCLGALQAMLHQPESVLGVAIEPVQEKTGRRVSVRFLKALRSACDEAGVPLVMNESAAWAYRGSRELFYCQATGVEPDLLTAYAGGQLGHVFTNDKYYIPEPLTLISTWDGDELSALRFHQQMELLRAHRDDSRLYELDKLIGSRGDLYRGSGLLFFDGEDLACDPDIFEEGHLLLPPLNRIGEQWEFLWELFEQKRTPAGV